MFEGIEAGAARSLSPLVLAYVGDAVHELYVRTRLARQGPTTLQPLHQAAVRRVRAESQARALDHLKPTLSETELAWVRRGRNAAQVPRRGLSLHQVHASTGFEALVGFLYLTGAHARLKDILEQSWQIGEETRAPVEIARQDHRSQQGPGGGRVEE